VSVQATIINLLTELQQTLGLSMLFVSHNMAVVRQVSDRIAVMYRGRVVETGPTATVFDHPTHPYTKLLLSSVPRMLTSEHAPAEVGVVAAPAVTGTATAGGCRFLSRCPVSTPDCAVEPGLRAVPGLPGTSAACTHVPAAA
jgi:oligopeptide/dipeptide ABC transporter ATP-binding protein